jgi:hypothetical protein
MTKLTQPCPSWPIGAIKTPGFGRKGLVHNVIDFMDSPFKLHGFDDEASRSLRSPTHGKHTDE